MSRTLYVPDDAEGDEVVMRLIPNIWRMAQSEARKRRGGDGE